MAAAVLKQMCGRAEDVRQEHAANAAEAYDGKIYMQEDSSMGNMINWCVGGVLG